jgi:hypothetical protein
MGFTLRGHRVCSTPSKGCGEDLGALVALLTSGPGKHSVRKSRVWQPRVAEHPVISWESSCERRVDTRSYPSLRRPLHSLFCFRRGYHPPVG